MITNFGSEPYVLDATDAAAVVLATADHVRGEVPGESTVWIAPADLLS
ncbi:MAG: hypothetical protein IE935_16540 [Micrococcales bacterium]|nr:hypothetical protein [Micrococcales bacterium]